MIAGVWVTALGQHQGTELAPVWAPVVTVRRVYPTSGDVSGELPSSPLRTSVSPSMFNATLRARRRTE